MGRPSSGRCKFCHGSGRFGHRATLDCIHCKGTGQCRYCNGSGTHVYDPNAPPPQCCIIL